MVSPDEAAPLSQVRKARTCITPAMLIVLQRAFEVHGGHPPNSVRHNLAMQLGITPKSVQVWFQNRRQKLRAAKASSQTTPAAMQQPDGDGQGVTHAEHACEPHGFNGVLRCDSLKSAAQWSPPMTKDGGVLSALLPNLSADTLSPELLHEIRAVTTAEQNLFALAEHLNRRKAELFARLEELSARLQQRPPSHPLKSDTTHLMPSADTFCRGQGPLASAQGPLPSAQGPLISTHYGNRENDESASESSGRDGSTETMHAGFESDVGRSTSSDLDGLTLLSCMAADSHT